MHLLRSITVYVLGLALVTSLAGCGRSTTSTTEGPAATPVKRPLPDPAQIPADVDADAERVIAAMKPEWQAMLAKAEVHDRQERVGWCVTCHMDIQDQLAGSQHDKQKISCVECHGPSERHARDENNEIKPDELFARADVDRVCSECHDCGRDVKLDTAVAAGQVCTDCHTAHHFPLTLAEVKSP